LLSRCPSLATTWATWNNREKGKNGHEGWPSWPRYGWEGIKQVAKFCTKRVRTRDDLSHGLSSSEARTNKGEIHPEQLAATNTDRASTSIASSHSTIAEENYHNNSTNFIIEEQQPTSQMGLYHDDMPRAGHSREGNQHATTSNVEAKLTMLEHGEIDQTDISKPPLASHCPELLSLIGHDGDECSAIALTRTMVWQLNSIFRCEAKILSLSKKA
jgi:hypothetical protein